MVKHVLNGNSNGRRPLLWWEDQMQKDMRNWGAGTEAAED